MTHQLPETTNVSPARRLGNATLRRMIIAAFGVGCFAGCVQTQLHGTPMGDGFVRLAAAAPRKIKVAVNVSPQRVAVGRQWVFGFLPLGRIEVTDESQRISVAIFKQLALRGYAPTIIPRTTEASSESHHNPSELTITSVFTSCSVPDIFFARIVRCSVQVSGFAASAPDVLLSSSGASSHLRMVGFTPQLEHELEHATSEALDGLLDHMHL